ncbi:MAG TPA: hypothetical protein VN493_24790 [Thermoanaerobaculia bacterium]|nr:hypothetical protein [Thermoanaerobaculia bacterium]
MKPLPIALALFLTVGAAHAAPASPGSRRADARQLLRLAEAGAADISKAAQASQGRVARSRPEQRPFWQSVNKMEGALKRVRAGMLARDTTFFPALENGSVVLGELRVAWARMGVPDPGVAEGVRILSQSYQLLRVGYGREAVRHRKGRGLTEDERLRFLRIQQAQQRFADLLKELQERAQKRGDAALLAELQRMAAEAERIAAAQLTLEAYLNALMIADAQRGEWTANTQYAAPEDRDEWQEAATAVEELYTEEEIGHVFLLDLGNLDGLNDLNDSPAPAPLALTHFEESTEIPESLAEPLAESLVEPGVQVYEAVELDLVEEEQALFEEEMEETADISLEVVEEIVEIVEEEPGEIVAEEVAAEHAETAEDTEAEGEEEASAEGEVEKQAEGEAAAEVLEDIEVEDLAVEEKAVEKKGEKAVPQTAVTEKERKEPAPPTKSKKKGASPPVKR